MSKKDGAFFIGSVPSGAGGYDADSAAFETRSISSGTYSFASRSLTRYGYGSTGATSYRTETDACSDADPDAYVSGSDSASVAFVSAPEGSASGAKGSM